MAGSRRDGWFPILARAPWPAGIVVGFIAFVLIDQVLPRFIAGFFMRLMPPGHVAPIHLTLRPLAYLAMGVCFAASAASFFGRHRRKALLASQRDLATLRALSWQDFEQLVGEAYRQQGYAVTETGQGGADGGVDLVLARGGFTDLVQCKHWKKSSVGAAVVREMYGLLFAHKASRIKVITSGDFTREARRFAAGKPIDLVDGAQLVELVQSVQRGERSSTPEPGAAEAPECPKCGRPMVRRTARQSQTTFWGCTQFPACRGTRP